MAVLQNFSVYAGDDQQVEIDVTGVNLTAASATFRVFTQAFGLPVTPHILEKTSLGGQITITPTPPTLLSPLLEAKTLFLLGNYYFNSKIITSLTPLTPFTHGSMT